MGLWQLDALERWDADHEHARRPSGSNTVRRILQRDGSLGGSTEETGRFEIDIRGGFGAINLVTTDDDIERVGQIRRVQRHSYEPSPRVGGKRDR